MQQQFVFFGNPRFAEIILSDLIDAGFIPNVVICSPDKPVGRKQILTSSPVKQLAQQKNIPVIQPEKLSEMHLSHIPPNTLFAVVAAYAYIIPKNILNLFPKGVIGIHPSLLPLYRGASPIQTALLDGVSSTGTSLYLMDEKMDHGPILAQETVPIEENDTYQTLEKKLAHTSAKLAIKTIPLWLNNSLTPIKQEHNKATYTKKFVTQDGFVDLEKDTGNIIAQKIKALSPDPGVFTFIDGKRIKLCQVKKIDGNWVITKIIPEGKKERETKIVLNNY